MIKNWEKINNVKVTVRILLCAVCSCEGGKKVCSFYEENKIKEYDITN